MMPRLLLILLLALSTPALAQTGIAGNGGLGIGGNTSVTSAIAANPAGALDAMSAAGQARKTNMLGFSIGPINPTSLTNTNQTTFVVVASLQALSYGLRFAVADMFNQSMTISSAYAYVTDSFAGAAPTNSSWIYGQGTPTTVVPTTNSVYQTCTLSSSSTTAVCSNTALLPSASTMNVIPTTGNNYPILNGIWNTTATVANSTNITLSSTPSVSGPYLLQFTNFGSVGGGQGVQFCFDNQGAAPDYNVDQINATCTNTSLTIAPNAANPTNTDMAYTLQWSDWVALPVNLARADGGTQPLVMIYVTIAANSHFGRTLTNLDKYNANIAGSLNGKYIFAGSAHDAGDYAATPASDPFLDANYFHPIMAVQYMTDAGGWEIAGTGDSLFTSPPDDDISSGPFRACALISTLLAPCEFVNFGWGGHNWSVYGEAMRNNVFTFSPSALIFEATSRNETGGYTAANFAAMFSRQYALATTLKARIGYYDGFPGGNTIDGLPNSIAAWRGVRSRLAVISKTCQPSTGGLTCPHIPILDPVPVVSRASTTYTGYAGTPGNDYDYLSMSQTANGPTSAGATTINITTPEGGINCNPLDVLTDTTTSGVVKSGALVTSATSTALTVPSNTVIGGGILSGDTLVCSYGGYIVPAGSGYSAVTTEDNIHPWSVAWNMLAQTSMTFIQQLLGLQ